VTKDETKQLIEASEAVNRAVLDIVCPPGTLLLLALTWIIGIPGLIFLFVVTR
jgi:hypothetical protein